MSVAIIEARIESGLSALEGFTAAASEVLSDP